MFSAVHPITDIAKIFGMSVSDQIRQLKLGGLINRDLARFGLVKDLMHLAGHVPEQLREIDRMADRS